MSVSVCGVEKKAKGFGFEIGLFLYDLEKLRLSCRIFVCSGYN